MNARRMWTIWVAIAGAVVVLMVPPWKTGMGTYGRSYCGGYAPIWMPPEGSVSVDLERILLEVLALSSIAGGVLATERRP
ncbi:MAG: hypothetical protein ACP5VE_02380 [Chthonomonadales bacterium]